MFSHFMMTMLLCRYPIIMVNKSVNERERVYLVIFALHNEIDSIQFYSTFYTRKSDNNELLQIETLKDVLILG